MSVDPHNNDRSAGQESAQQHADDPRVREALELEERMRRALATKEDPLRDDESSSERLRRLDREQEGADGPAD